MTRVSTDIAEALAVLDAGGLVGLPTETVYGLAADATRREAVSSVFRAKGRPTGHPLIVHVAGPEALDRWAVDVPPAARALVETWWPGPVTVLLRRHERVLDEITGGRHTVALRAPAHPMAMAVLDALESSGRALVAPSANRFGRVSPTCAADVVDELGDVVDLVLDGGACAVGIESAIVDLSGDVPKLLRSGQVSLEVLAESVPGLVAADVAAPSVAPGMLASHYAPAARVLLLAHDASRDDIDAAIAAQVAAGLSVGLLVQGGEGWSLRGVTILDAGPDAESYARSLYGLLRAADDDGLDVIVAVPPVPIGAGVAVTDRLQRAAHPRQA
jgi:L-threonylcarbamoyladenylate synthase